MKFKSYLLATAATVAFIGGAAAADMPVKAVRYTAATMNWSGCYVGVHGAAVSHKDGFNGDDPEFDGIGGSSSQLVGGAGGQIGCNWQDQNLVYGIEGDATFFKAKHDSEGFDDTDYWYHSQADWLATIRGRVGITAGSGGATLLYVTGGIAFGGVRDGVITDEGAFTSRKTLVGWTAGFGVEHMLTQNWTVKAEAGYVDLGTNNERSDADGTYNINHSHEFFTGKVGLNYKF